jgi:DNA processing protein
MARMTPDDSSYPAALKALASPPDLTTSRDLPVGLTAIAIVGTREPIPEARELAYELGRAVAAAGAVVVSGGAVGIDRAAHEGALAADGVTLAVVGTGKDHVFPAEHADLYERIAASRGAMVWPFPDDRGPRTAGFLRRNGVLVALSSAVVVVQAGKRSGALNAASWARRLGRTLWVVPQAPWAAAGRGHRRGPLPALLAPRSPETTPGGPLERRNRRPFGHGSPPPPPRRPRDPLRAPSG